MALTTAGKIDFIAKRIEYQARPLATVEGMTTYGMAAETFMGGKHIVAKAKFSDYEVYPGAVIAYADRLKGLITLACFDPEFSHADVMVRDVRWMFDAPTVTPE